jgi:hypothetical protein
MVRRRSTVRFRNGAPEHTHEKRHPTSPETVWCRSPFSPAVCGPRRSPTAVCAEYAPRFSALRGQQGCPAAAVVVDIAVRKTPLGEAAAPVRAGALLPLCWMLVANSLPADTRERRRAPRRHRGQQTIGANRTSYAACPGWWIDRGPLVYPVIHYLSKVSLRRLAAWREGRHDDRHAPLRSLWRCGAN